MRRFLLLVVLLLLALPLTVLAQDDETVPIAGDYTYEGDFLGTPYSGEMSLVGTGPVYTLNYIETTDVGPQITSSVPAMSVGDIVIAATEGADCAPGSLIRQSDGRLFGIWIDWWTTNPAVGVEYATPREETTGFAGVYDVVGSYSDGSQYVATIEIAENEDGWYDVRYVFEYDEIDQGAESPDDVGIGLVSGNVLGYAYQENDAAGCAVYVADFLGDGTFEAAWVSSQRVVGTETGVRHAPES